MNWNRYGSILLLCFFALTNRAVAQRSEATKPVAISITPTIPALFVSDIHFEPFWDPAKVPQLASAPVSGWKAILAAPVSADRAQRIATLAQACRTRGEDTSYALLESSLQAIKTQAADAKFVTVSGDLMAHSFSCKYQALFPNAASGEYRKFTEKTLGFVMQELSDALPGVPVYVGLGNNDSDCGDYQLDGQTEFLSVIGGQATRAAFPASEKKSSLKGFEAGGYFSVSLPSPVKNARLLVLNDIFMSSKYSTCAGKADITAADEQIAWLDQQLSEARRNKEKIWVMGHIPPGVDVHATVTKMRDVCGGKKPEMFLSSEKLANKLIEFSDVIQLAIFAHTHMDEMHILSDASSSTPPKSVAIKMVASISPIDGNLPSFTVARIDPASATLEDYRVIVASNPSGIGAKWQQEYDYAQSYHQADFSVASVSKLIAGFEADPAAKTEASRAYISNFIAGTASPLLAFVWPQYVCGAETNSAQGYRACVCPAAK